jgi:hypothetical protein
METPSTTDALLHNKLSLGSFLDTPAGCNLFVLACIVDGHTSVVYKCQNNGKTLYALKITRSNEEKFIRSIQSEHRKAIELFNFEVGIPAVVEVGTNYCMREWIEGVRGDVWYHQWRSSHYDPNDRGFKELVKLWINITSQGYYVQNLKGLNLIWSSAGWTIIDSGYKKPGSPETCMLRFCTHFDRKWQNKHTSSCHHPEPMMTMQTIISQHGLYDWSDIQKTKDDLVLVMHDRAERKLEKKREYANLPNSVPLTSPKKKTSPPPCMIY